MRITDGESEEAISMGDRKQKDFVGPIILIVLGVLLLLNTTGVVPWEAWESLWRFWPVLLILWGVGIVFGRGSPIGRIVVLALLALFIVFAVSNIASESWWGWGRRAADRAAPRGALPYSKTLTVSSAQFSPSRVRLSADIGAGKVFIHTGSGGDILTAVASYSRASRAPRLVTSMAGSVLNVDYSTERGFTFLPFIYSRPDEHTLTLGRREIPTELDLEVGGGTLDAVLEGLSVTAVSIEVGGGTVKMGFPEAPTGRPAASSDWGARTLRFEIGAGTAEIAQIGNTGVQRVSGSIGSGTAYLDFGGTRLSGVVTGDIEVGAGKLQLHVPADVGVRLDCDIGVGSLRIDGRQYGRRGLGAHETWESANYAGASVRLDLRVEAGTGSIEVTSGR
jgi:hypothetical protein